MILNFSAIPLFAFPFHFILKWKRKHRKTKRNISTVFCLSHSLCNWRSLWWEIVLVVCLLRWDCRDEEVVRWCWVLSVDMYCDTVTRIPTLLSLYQWSGPGQTYNLIHQLTRRKQHSSVTRIFIFVILKFSPCFWRTSNIPGSQPTNLPTSPFKDRITNSFQRNFFFRRKFYLDVASLSIPHTLKSLWSVIIETWTQRISFSNFF